MWFIEEALDVLVAVAGQPDLDFVLAILRKRVVDERAAPCPDRQALDVLFLRDDRSPTVTLSKPKLDSSTGSIDATSTSRSSRS